MIASSPAGRFQLKSGVRLIPGDGEATLILSSPLKVVKINGPAYDLLARGDRGSTPDETKPEAGPSSDGKTSLFWDALCRIGLVDWKPPEGFEPFVSIVVPVFNRAREIGRCLESLAGLDYPASRLEIIVVDDASTDQSVAVTRDYSARLIVQPFNRGQSAARNTGVREAKGDIVAFIDSDCLADPDWLRRLVPYFQDERVALVGGLVEAADRESLLDRYEEVRSPLNMGRKKLIGESEASDFYVPACNMLVRKEAYLRAGGLDESLRIGEDVDLCWRLKAKGARLLYVPEGRVRHKHRARFIEGFGRRFDYGTSEGFLYARYPLVQKRFPRQTGGLLFFLLCTVGLAVKPWFLLPMAGAVLFIDAALHRRMLIRKSLVRLPYFEVLAALLRAYHRLSYHLASHAVRYFLLPLFCLAVAVPALSPSIAAWALFPGLVEFIEKKPRLNPAVFLVLYWVEQICYQCGVFRGCLKQGSFRSYRLTFAR